MVSWGYATPPLWWWIWSFSSMWMQSSSRPCQGHHGGGEYLCPAYSLCSSPGCWDKGLSDRENAPSHQAELSLQEGRTHLLHHLCSSMSSLIPPHSLQCQGRLNFNRSSNRTYRLHFTCAQRQGTIAPEKLAQSPASGHVDHPVRVFCTSSSFFDFQRLFL